jgi:hypothetical protein
MMSFVGGGFYIYLHTTFIWLDIKTVIYIYIYMYVILHMSIHRPGMLDSP